MSKPREFWMHESLGHSYNLDEIPTYRDKKTYTHVIEHSALAERDAEIIFLKDAHKGEVASHCRSVNNALMEVEKCNVEIAALKTKLEEFKAQYENCRYLAVENSKLKEQLEIARQGLRDINQEELNSQRPGGGYSRSATISFETLAKIGMKDE